MEKREVIYRHSGAVRITHWVNALVLLVLLMSGLQIFNAHPALYLGAKSNFDDPMIAMRADEAWRQGQRRHHAVRLASSTPPACSASPAMPTSDYDERGFPWSVTLPGHRDLSMGRRWHFFFAWLFLFNGLAYLALEPRQRASPARSRAVGQGPQAYRRLDRRACAGSNSRKGDEAKRYNVLQKLSYLIVALVLLPLMLVTGLAMSPGMDAAFPILLDVLGGRQTARTIHFIAASVIVIFVVVHLVMVLISGVWNNLRSMITGRYVIEPAEEKP